MNPFIKDPHTGVSRRNFLAGASAVAALQPMTSRAAAVAQAGAAAPLRQTGNGSWTYDIVPGWGALPAGTVFGGTHGAVAADNAGRVYVSTQSRTGVIVYTADGRYLHTIAQDYPEIHSLVHSEEKGEEYFYATVQHGTPEANWLFLKMRLDGTVVLKITAPKEAGFEAGNLWRITAALPAPDGSIWIANGYGDSRLFRFDAQGNYQRSYGSKGTADGQFVCSHGLAVDTRYGQPLLLVVDRENRRLCHLDFDGTFVRHIALHLRRPCQVSFAGDHLVVSELEGRVTILDRDNVPVAFLGDNPRLPQRANYNTPLAEIEPATFTAAHGCFVDAKSNIYISDWNHTGRVTKLSPVRMPV